MLLLLACCCSTRFGFRLSVERARRISSSNSQQPAESVTNISTLDDSLGAFQLTTHSFFLLHYFGLLIVGFTLVLKFMLACLLACRLEQ